MAQNEDTADIKAFLSGDGKGLDRLVLRHQERIFNLCYRLLGDYSDAEECAQETFVKVFRSLGGFRLQSSFSTWLYTIAVNTCKNRRKSGEYRFWRRILPFGRNSDEREDCPEYEIEDETPSALAQIADKEMESQVQAAINGLSHDHRTVIVLRHVQELSYEEIAAITGYNLGTLKSKLARARQELQRRLEGVYGENRDGMRAN